MFSKFVQGLALQGFRVYSLGFFGLRIFQCAWFRFIGLVVLRRAGASGLGFRAVILEFAKTRGYLILGCL